MAQFLATNIWVGLLHSIEKSEHYLKMLASAYKELSVKKVTFSKKVFKLPIAENFQQQVGPVCSNQNVQISISILDNNFIFNVEFYSRDKALRVKMTFGKKE